jgi:hypothetical protein
MPVATTSPLVLPAATDERLEIPDIRIDGYPDPTDLDVDWQLSDTATTLTEASLLDPGDWSAGTWFDASTIRTGLIGPLPPGTYGAWVRIHAGDETIVRWAGRVVLT